MLNDSVQYLHANDMFNKASLNIRKNPFMLSNGLDNTADRSMDSGQSDMSSENRLLTCDHFDRPLDYCDTSSSIDELSSAVKECKLKILSLADDIISKERYIDRLIELNEALHTAKEKQKCEVQPDIMSSLSQTISVPMHIAGHIFAKYRHGFKYLRYCEVCSGTLKTGRNAYNCQNCLVHIHSSKSCIQGLHRACPASDRDHPSLFSSLIITNRRFSSSDSGYHIDIDSYPVPGSLTSQKFLCTECSFPLKSISGDDLNSSTRSLPKFCHYYRKFYCYNCHWGDRFFIPSVYFLLNKWKKMSVSRSAFIKLSYIWDKALFRMPIFWEQNLAQVKDVLVIRKRLFSLRIFIYHCETLRKITQSSSEWIIDQPYLITMKFAQDLCDGTASQTVQILYSNIIAHIPQCEQCQRLCNACHLCDNPEKLYVVSRNVLTCSICFLTCVHENCGLKQYQNKAEYVCHNCSKL